MRCSLEYKKKDLSFLSLIKNKNEVNTFSNPSIDYIISKYKKEKKIKKKEQKKERIKKE